MKKSIVLLAITAGVYLPLSARQFTLLDIVAEYPGTNHGGGAAFVRWFPYPKVPKNWITPTNYKDGTAHVRYSVLDKQDPGTFSTVATFWSRKHHDTIHKHFPKFSNIQQGRVYTGSNAIQDLHTDGGPVDWRWDEAVDEGYIACTCPVYRHIWQTTADTTKPLYDEMKPITLRVTVIIVSQGGTFQQPSWWKTYGAAPGIDSAVAWVDTTEVTGENTVAVRFNWPVQKPSAEVTTNYNIGRGIDATSAVLSADKRSVVLTLDETVQPGIKYSIRISNVVDSLGTKWYDHLIYFQKADASIRAGQVRPINMNRVMVYPNPMQDITNFRVYDNETGLRPVFTILDQTGNTVHHTVGANGRSPLQWYGTDIAGHPVKPGVYYYTIKTGSGQVTGALIKTE